MYPDLRKCTCNISAHALKLFYTRLALQTKTDTCANSVDPDETARHFIWHTTDVRAEWLPFSALTGI